MKLPIGTLARGSGWHVFGHALKPRLSFPWWPAAMVSGTIIHTSVAMSGTSAGSQTSSSIIVLLKALARRHGSDSCPLSLAKSLFLADAECQISIDTWRHMPAMASKFQIGTPVHESLSDSSHEVTQDRSREKRQVPLGLSSRHSARSTSRSREFHISDTRTPPSPRCPQN